MLDFLAALKRPIRAEDIDRLTEEREAADKDYNEALTNLDQALPTRVELPPQPVGFDDAMVQAINQRWKIVPTEMPAFTTGWKGRIRMVIWRMLAPIFERQQWFNAAVVDHVNRTAPAGRDTVAATASTLAILRQHLDALESFQSRLILYAQRITPYIDSKDREFTGYVEHRVVGLSGGLDGVSDELQKRWESMVTRERRLEARVAHAEAQVAALNESVGAATRMAATLKREMDRLAVVGSGIKTLDSRSEAPARPAGVGVNASVDSYKYVGFEDQFRGAAEEIRSRLADYVSYFEGASDVLDVGCGRGELLELLRERGVSGRGIDINHEMVEVCRSKGLDVTEDDVLAYLSGLPDESLGGLIAAQVVEHLTADYLIRFLDEAYRTLRPGSTIILETINPACWLAFFESYIRDITHRHPVHPDTMKYLLVASGFQQVAILFRAPYPESEKLKSLPEPSLETAADVPLHALTNAFNANVERMNGLLFTYLDYAGVGKKI